MTENFESVPGDLRVTVTDVRRAGFCVTGLREYCERCGLDLRAWIKDGVPISVLRTLPPDANINRVIEIAMKRHQETTP